MDDTFRILCRKDIYEFLEGSGDNQLVEYNGVFYGLPYHTASELDSICRSFGYTGELIGSRWQYVETLMNYAIEHERCDELLKYLFSLEQFNNLQDISSMKEIEVVHAQIINKAIEIINWMIRLSKKELQLVGGRFFIVEVGTTPVIQTPKIDTFTVSYVRSLRERCETDMRNGEYDSVITKSRTMMEETMIHIIEDANETPSDSGKIRELYKQVKEIRNMKQNNAFDNRVNGLLGGLEKIVENIGDMRNINSDAHGVGKSRISIREKEARLVMNSAISFCEYLL